MNEDSIMKYQFLQAKFAKLLLFCAAFGVFFSAFVSTTQAQTQAETVTFAQFIQRPAAQDFRFTNNTSSGTFDTVPSGSPIFFVYSNIAGLDQSLRGSQEARVFITTTMPTTTPATLSNNTLIQPLNQTVVITILRDEATAPGVGTGNRTNLLTATISTNSATPAITGTDTGNSAAFAVTTPDHTITYTSDFLNFSGTMQRNLGLSFSSVTPSLALGAGNFLQSFTAAGTGTFASNPPPVAVSGGTTAASVSISGRVLTPSRRGLRGARVSLIGEDGTTQTVLSNNSGYYHFSDVMAGQTAILSVNSKRYSYVPQVLTVTEDINDLNFTGQ